MPGWAPRPSLDPVRMTVAASADSIRVLVAALDRDVRNALAGVLVTLGHDLLGSMDGGADLVRRAAMLRPDIILLDAMLLAAPTPFSAAELAASSPRTSIVLFCSQPDVRLRDDDTAVMAALAYLPRPVPPAVVDATVRLAVARGRALASAREEAAEARQQLANRKVIERAKGILMRRTGATEAEAYSILRRTSQDNSVPMTAIARAVLESEPDGGEQP
jgi:response regulator NasT